MAGIHSLTPDEIVDIKPRLISGEFQHKIAADYDLNQVRISEINTGKCFPHVPWPKESIEDE